MEWSGGQQVNLLLESMGLGVPLGLLFDIMSGCIPLGRKNRVRRYLMDVMFGLFSAIITFYGSLAIMDGRMHPLLFVGCFLGFVTERLCFGRFISRMIRRVNRFFSRVFRSVYRFLEGTVQRFFELASGICRKKRKKIEEM